MILPINISQPVEDSEKQRDVDALLAAGSSKFLLAGELMSQMRAYHRLGQSERYWRTANVLAETLTVAGHCVNEANRILLGRMGVDAPQRPEERVH